MPVRTLDQIKAMIAANEFAGVTLDTSIFDQYGCNLSFPSLLALKQFRGSRISVILSAITTSEVRAHITSAMRDTATKLKQALNQYDRKWRLGLDKAAVEATIGVNGDPAARASAMIDEFLAATGATVVPVEPGASMQQVVDLYFGAHPPFSDKNSKKHEFPDAIALLCLESWAAAHGPLLAISRDDDWRRYAEVSAHIVCLEELPTSLALFNDVDSVIGARIAADLREGKSTRLKREIDRALERFVGEFDIEASSGQEYDADSDGAQVLYWSVVPGDVNVVSSDNDTLTFVLEVEGEIEFYAVFRFYHWDSVDREYIRLPSTSASTTNEVTLEVAITIYKDELELNDPQPFEVTVQSSTLTADFHYVEPDLR